MRSSIARNAAVLAAGALFGYGLALSTMIRPEVVLSFLRLKDFGLLLVLGGALGVALVGYQTLPRLLERPVLGGGFGTRPAQLDRDTIAGAALFGVGWGISGVCPGPAIAGLGAGSWELVWAVGGMLLGGLLHGLVRSDARL